MPLETRRSFNGKLLGTLAAYGLIETLFQRDAFADGVKPVITKWMTDLNDLTKSLKADHKLKDTEFQTKLEDLYKVVDLAKVEGLPARIWFGKQIFCLKKGRSVVPHGHNNMCTGFIILRGTFEGK